MVVRKYQGGGRRSSAGVRPLEPKTKPTTKGEVKGAGPTEVKGPPDKAPVKADTMLAGAEQLVGQGQAPISTGGRVAANPGTVMGLRLQGSHGLKGGSKAEAEGARRHPDGPAFWSREFAKILDQKTNSSARTGNKVTLLFDGHNSFAERNRLIGAAKSSIHLQTFVFSDDETGWELAKLLAAKAEQGVEVRFIYDAVGSAQAKPEIFDYMRERGVEVRKYGDPLTRFWNINERWHEKHLIIDGKVSIQGGMNIANEYAFGGSGRMFFDADQRSKEPWRDVDMKLEGPSVADTQRAFLKNWAVVDRELSEAEQAELFPEPSLAKNSVSVRFVQHRPDQEGDQNTNNLYVQAIRSATKSITIENAYLIPPKDVREALIDAAQRGVSVKVLTNSAESNNHTIVSEAGRYFYDEMVAAGVEIYEKKGSTLHSKTATFDGFYSLVGSCNLNGRSKGLDSESVLAVKDPETARQLEERFAEGIQGATKVSAEELAAEGLGTNLKQWALSCLAWTF